MSEEGNKCRHWTLRPRSRERGLTVLEALQIIVDQADKARNLMRQEGLSPDDIRMAMVYVIGDTGKFGIKWLPPSAHVSPFFDYFVSLADKQSVFFLGIMWHQKTADGAYVSWITQLSGGVEAARLMLRARAILLPPRAN